MARPIKEGLDYFPLDVNADYDDKFQIIEGLHGAVGFATVIKLLMKIYDNGYFYSWTEQEQVLMIKRIGIDLNSMNNIVNDCVKYGLFSEKLFSEYQILTSDGIQLRYFTAAGKRKKGTVLREYLLLDEEELKILCPNMQIKRVIHGKTTNKQGLFNEKQESSGVIQESGTQRKGKERKEKERKEIVEQDGPARRDVSPAYEDIVDYLNAKAGKNYKHTTKATQEKIRARMAEGFGLDDFKTVIDNKVRHWKGDPSNDRYLRPETLFGPKFESYLQENPNLKPTQKKRANDFTMSAESERELEEQIKEREMLSKMSFLEQNEYFRRKQEAANGR